LICGDHWPADRQRPVLGQPQRRRGVCPIAETRGRTCLFQISEHRAPQQSRQPDGWPQLLCFVQCSDVGLGSTAAYPLAAGDHSNGRSASEADPPSHARPDGANSQEYLSTSYQAREPRLSFRATYMTIHHEFRCGG
jgi:hypothetical protein